MRARITAFRAAVNHHSKSPASKSADKAKRITLSDIKGILNRTAQSTKLILSQTWKIRRKPVLVVELHLMQKKDQAIVT